MRLSLCQLVASKKGNPVFRCQNFRDCSILTKHSWRKCCLLIKVNSVDLYHVRSAKFLLPLEESWLGLGWKELSLLLFADLQTWKRCLTMDERIETERTELEDCQILFLVSCNILALKKGLGLFVKIVLPIIKHCQISRACLLSFAYCIILC